MCEEQVFYQRVWQVVAAIPPGKVVTYGDIAHLAGFPRSARQVGRVLKHLPPGSKLPWHRVVNCTGKLFLRGESLIAQRKALLAEGIDVSPEGKLPLKQYRWKI